MSPLNNSTTESASTSTSDQTTHCADSNNLELSSVQLVFLDNWEDVPDESIFFGKPYLSGDDNDLTPEKTPLSEEEKAEFDQYNDALKDMVDDMQELMRMLNEIKEEELYRATHCCFKCYCSHSLGLECATPREETTDVECSSDEKVNK